MFVEIESIPVLFFAANVLVTRITVDSDTQSKVNDVIIACFRFVATVLVPVIFRLTDEVPRLRKIH